MEIGKTNIEVINRIIVEETFITDLTIYDGISIECKIPDKKTFKQCKSSIDKMCKNYKLLPVICEERKEKDRYFLVQFPELDPYYTEEQLYNMFYKSLEYLVNTAVELSKRGGVIVTRKMLLDSIEKYIASVIRMYYNSNVNKYKVVLKDLLNNMELRDKIKQIFYEVIKDFK